MLRSAARIGLVVAVLMVVPFAWSLLPSWAAVPALIIGAYVGLPLGIEMAAKHGRRAY